MLRIQHKRQQKKNEDVIGKDLGNFLEKKKKKNRCNKSRSNLYTSPAGDKENVMPLKKGSN